MKPIYINSVSAEYLIENSLNRALYTMLNAVDVSIPSLGYDWDTSRFLRGVALNVSTAMYNEGERIMKIKVKDFRPDKTRLTKDVVEDMWLAGSKEFANEIAKGFLQETKNVEGKNNRIPGLEKIVKEGGIVSHVDGFRNSDDPDQEVLEKHYEELRNQLIKNLENADYRDEFLRIARNNFFNYLQDKFEIFSDGTQEMKIH